MSIPVRNIYFLLAYAWDCLEEADVVDVSEEDFKTVADLLAKVLAAGVRHLTKRGLDRGYRERAETLNGIRGKLDFDTSLRVGLFIQGRAHCLFEELTADVVHNQIVAQTMRELLKVDDLDPDIADGLRVCLHRMGPLSPIRLSRAVFARIQLHGNNAFYRFLLEICKLVYEASAIDEISGKRRFRDFVKDDGPLARLFERFVFNFYKREQTEYRVSGRRIEWEDTWGTEDALSMLPVMRTDVYLDSPQRRVVIDTKYYRQALSGNFGNDAVRSAHLYQLFAYLRNIQVRENARPTVEGVLLYPRVDQTLELDYIIHGHRLRVLTIDLAAHWSKIREALLRV